MYRLSLIETEFRGKKISEKSFVIVRYYRYKFLNIHKESLKVVTFIFIHFKECNAISKIPKEIENPPPKKKSLENFKENENSLANSNKDV